jgi:hypothetical protein
VGCAFDLYDLASSGALGHKAVGCHGDVLVELPKHEPRRKLLPRLRPRGIVERDVPHRPLAHSHQGGLLGRDVLRELLMVLLLADVEIGAAVGEGDGPQGLAKRALGAKPATYTSALTLSRAALVMTVPP